VTNYYGYGRASTGEQSLTIDAQRDKAEKACAAKGVELEKFFEETATSSRIPFAERTEGAVLTDLIEKGKVKVIIIAKLDRAFRSTIECLTSIIEWNKKGVEIIILDMNVDTSTLQGKFFLTIMAGFAEMERGLISERTSTAMKSAQANGLRMGSVETIPFGFMVDKSSQLNDKGKHIGIVKCPKEQEMLALMLSRKSSGVGYSAIAAELNGNGDFMRKGQKWYRQAVQGILKKKLQMLDSSPAL